jgi:hypothetical protein
MDIYSVTCLIAFLLFVIIGVIVNYPRNKNKDIGSDGSDKENSC